MIGRIVHAMTNCMVSSQTSMAPQNAAQPATRRGRFSPSRFARPRLTRAGTSAPPRTDRHSLECRRAEVTSSDNTMPDFRNAISRVVTKGTGPEVRAPAAYRR